MRVAREHKRVQPERRVFLNACRHRLRVTHQGGARAAAHQTHARPQVGADFQVLRLRLAPPACKAAMRRWPSESMRANTAWARTTVSSLTWLMSSSAAAQACSSVSRTMTCRRMPNHGAAMLGGALAHIGSPICRMASRIILPVIFVATGVLFSGGSCGFAPATSCEEVGF